MKTSSLLVLLLTLCCPQFARAVETVVAQAARFDKLVAEYGELTSQNAESVQQPVEELRAELDSLISQIVETGIAIYQQNPSDHPKVNMILTGLAGFFITGDYLGDGGDQYEKALPIAQTLIEGGTAEHDKNLWLWGGVSAYCMNQFDLAEKYLKQAEAAGLFQGLPRRPSEDVQILARQRGAEYLQSLPAIRKAWETEKQLRTAEATADNLPRVKFTTSRGDVIIELFEDQAPQAVANFITLVKQGYYDGIVFHRVLPQFMAQGGDPEGTGRGGPGYNIRCECYGPNLRKHFRGSLSMAHAGRNTGGSQFFLTFYPTSYLDGRHTVFGRVVEGIENASALKRRDPTPGAPSSKATPDKIIKAEVLRDRGHAYEFEKLPAR